MFHTYTCMKTISVLKTVRYFYIPLITQYCIFTNVLEKVFKNVPTLRNYSCYQIYVKKFELYSFSEFSQENVFTSNITRMIRPPLNSSQQQVHPKLCLTTNQSVTELLRFFQLNIQQKSQNFGKTMPKTVWHRLNNS